MKKTIILIIKGFFFGIANIIPGVSGGTIALTMGIYEDMISAISNFFKDIKKSILFLLPIFIGAGISILLMSKVISAALKHYPFPTTVFFIGLILGGIPLLTKKVRTKRVKPLNILIFLITFGIIMIMTFIKEGTGAISLVHLNPVMYLILFLVGIIAAATMVIPGVSGSFVLMLLGFYNPIVNTVSDITNFSHLMHNILVLIPFGIGVIVGIIGVAKIIEFLFKKYEVETYYGILGFIIASIIALAMTLFGLKIDIFQIIIALLLFVCATLIGYKLGDE